MRTLASFSLKIIRQFFIVMFRCAATLHELIHINHNNTRTHPYQPQHYTSSSISTTTLHELIHINHNITRAHPYQPQHSTTTLHELIHINHNITRTHPYQPQHYTNSSISTTTIHELIHANCMQTFNKQSLYLIVCFVIYQTVCLIFDVIVFSIYMFWYIAAK